MSEVTEKNWCESLVKRGKNFFRIRMNTMLIKILQNEELHPSLVCKVCKVLNVLVTIGLSRHKRCQPKGGTLPVLSNPTKNFVK